MGDTEIEEVKSVPQKRDPSPLPWSLGERAEVFARNGEDWIADCNQLNGLSFAESVANAAFICKAVNNHAALVAELQRLFKLYGHQATADVLRAVGGETGD